MAGFKIRITDSRNKMVKFVLDLFKIEKKPLKGLMAIEWAAAAYMLFTFVLIMFFYTK